MNRIRQDFDLTLVLTFGFITNLMILPFAVYRLIDDQFVAGMIDLLIVACITFGNVRAFVSGRTKGPALFLAVTYSIGCIGVAYTVGNPAPLWMYAALLSNFLLVDRMRAAVISAFAIIAVAASPLALPELMQKAAFLGSSVVVCLFSYSFAWRTDIQRRQLESLASMDPLTGAHNRRGLHTEIGIAMAASARSHRPLGLIIFDLDHFKQINDQFGHEAGDNVLVQVAGIVRRKIRKNDRFFRLGGEEFALLVPDANTDALRETTEKIRKSIEREATCGDRPITASFGASELRMNETESQWLDRVDAAMYRAKREGRNRSVIDDAFVSENADHIGRGNTVRALGVNTIAINRADLIDPTTLPPVRPSPKRAHTPGRRYCRR